GEIEDETFKFFPEPSQTCNGDSGGPAFATIDGVEYQIGTTRSGDPGCSMFGRDMRVDPFVESFIAPFIAHSAEGSAEMGDRCYYTENCVSELCMPAQDDPRINYCSRACLSNTDCPLGMTCGATNGALRCLLSTPTPGSLGASCTSDAECQDAT